MKSNNLGLALGTGLKFYTFVPKNLKLKFREFWGLISTFVEVTEEKLLGEAFCTPPVLNRVKARYFTAFLVEKFVKYKDTLSPCLT